MTLEDIKEKILSDAKAKAKKIEVEAQQQIEDMKSKTDKEIVEFRQKFLISVKQKALNVARSVLISSTMTKKNAILEKKRQILDNIFSQTIKELAGLDDEKYKQILTKQMETLKRTNLTELLIIAARGKSELVKKTADQILADSYQLSAKETDEITGGFIVKSNQTKIDFSFANMIYEIRPSLEGKIAKILFNIE